MNFISIVFKILQQHYTKSLQKLNIFLFHHPTLSLALSMWLFCCMLLQSSQIGFGMPMSLLRWELRLSQRNSLCWLCKVAPAFWWWLYIMLRGTCLCLFSLELFPCLRFLRVGFLHWGVWPLYFSFQRLWLAHTGRMNIPCSPQSHWNLVLAINLYFVNANCAMLSVLLCIYYYYFFNLLWNLAIFLHCCLASACRNWTSIASGHSLSLSGLETVMGSRFQGFRVLRRQPAKL